VRLDDALAVAEVKDAEARPGWHKQPMTAAARCSAERPPNSPMIGRTNPRGAAAVEFANARCQCRSTLLRRRSRLLHGVGRRLCDGRTKLVNLEKIDELKVEFSVPEVFACPAKGRGDRRCLPGEVYEARSMPSIRMSASTGVRCRCGLRWSMSI
jgi:hypothetical protein